MTARVVSITEGRKLDPNNLFWRAQIGDFGFVMCDPEPAPDDKEASRRARRKSAAEHLQDSDCTVDPETLLCSVCGVDHGGECIDCGGRGFHKPNCPWMEGQ